MTFKRLQIQSWRQFRDLDIEFHARLTIITGGNGAGKTTVLNLLSRHFGWQGTLVSTPRKKEKSKVFHSDYWTEESLRQYEKWLEHSETGEDEEPPFPPEPPGPQQRIGTLTYSEGSEAPLQVSSLVGPQYNVEIHGQLQQKGIHIPSHRPVYSYQAVESIPTMPRPRSQAFSQYMSIVQARYYGGHHQRTPNYFMKETLIALAAFGYGNAAIEKDHDSQETFEGFQRILQRVLPPSIGFVRIAIRLPEVVLVTRSGDFSIDAVSGGVAALVDLAWQVFMFGDEKEKFVVTLDEPENHLHPELQRTVLGSLLDAFPNVQFICASHNPFIVTSVPESNVYALRYGEDSRVSSQHLSGADRSGSSNEVLRDVLGLPSSSPLWVDAELQSIEAKLADRPLSQDLLNELRQELISAGLERFLPQSLANLAKGAQK
jgi:energy-coupling factor transporter ATP-binding protein EcfA2